MTAGEVPEQRRARELAAATQARRSLGHVRVATEALIGLVVDLDDRRMREPSLLPGWTRAHVVTHLARNADGLVNLLTWARTGVEHPMYASSADRDADIEEGADRLAQVVHEDLRAACDRFGAAGERMGDSQWSALVNARTPTVFAAARIPSIRLFELWVHTVDLNAGFTFEDIPAEQVEAVLESAVAPRLGGPVSARLRVALPDGREREFVLGPATPAAVVSGTAAQVLAWLTGRSGGAALAGEVPVLGPWG